MHPVPPASGCPNDYQHPEIANERYYVFFDVSRRWVRCSREVSEFLGYQMDELIGHTADKLIPPGVNYNREVWERFLSDGWIKRFMPLTKKSGHIVGVWVEYRRLQDGCMLAIMRPS